MRQFPITLLLIATAALFAADKPELTEAEAQQVIQKFAAKEAEFALAREVYTYRQSVKVQELGSGGLPGAEAQGRQVLGTGCAGGQRLWRPQSGVCLSADGNLHGDRCRLACAAKN